MQAGTAALRKINAAVAAALQDALEWGGTRMRGPFAVIMAVSMLVIATCLPSGADESARRGRQIVERDCARCHAVGAADASAMSKAPPFREIARRYPPSHLAEALAEGIVTGHPDMPVFAFAPADAGAIIAYLEALSEKR